MNTVSILPISDPSGENNYRAISGSLNSVGKTPGQALDALTSQLDEAEFRALLFLNSFNPDRFFDAKQQQRLGDLMNLWRSARDRGDALLLEQQTELDLLVDAELKAATPRTEALVMQIK